MNKFLNIFNLASGRVWQVHKEPGPTSAFSAKQLKGECITCELSVEKMTSCFGCFALWLSESHLISFGHLHPSSSVE